MAEDPTQRRSRLGRGLRTLGRIGRRLAGRADPPTPTGPVRVRFEAAGQGYREGEVQGGLTLLAAALELDVALTHYCGGMCSCGTCRVEIVEGAEHLSRPLGNEPLALGADAARRGDRLACQARILGPVVVRVPDWF